jgi:GTP-binding protein EngB required for normal cell division
MSVIKNDGELMDNIDIVMAKLDIVNTAIDKLKNAETKEEFTAWLIVAEDNQTSLFNLFGIPHRFVIDDIKNSVGDWSKVTTNAIELGMC